jgi:protoporphyrinogen oxidase
VNSAEPLGRVAIVGAGVAGLAAAYFLRGSGAEVVVLEASGRTGGKLLVSEVAGVPVTPVPRRCSPAVPKART